MKQMTQELRDRIKDYIKQGLDISNLIQDIDIKGEDFSYAIIKNFNRSNQNLSGLKLYMAQIGEEGKIMVISNNNMQNCNFTASKFIGKIFFRKNDCRNSKFNKADWSNVEYQFTDFRGCSFCDVIIRMGTDYGYKATFDEDMFTELTKYWIFVKKEIK